ADLPADAAAVHRPAVRADRDLRGPGGPVHAVPGPDADLAPELQPYADRVAQWLVVQRPACGVRGPVLRPGRAGARGPALAAGPGCAPRIGAPHWPQEGPAMRLITIFAAVAALGLAGGARAQADEPTPVATAAEAAPEAGELRLALA